MAQQPIYQQIAGDARKGRAGGALARVEIDPLITGPGTRVWPVDGNQLIAGIGNGLPDPRYDESD
jgi:hypothetical protein